MEKVPTKLMHIIIYIITYFIGTILNNNKISKTPLRWVQCINNDSLFFIYIYIEQGEDPVLLIIKTRKNMIILNEQITYYFNCKDSQGTSQYTLSDILHDIKMGKYRNLVSNVRNQTTIADYKKEKQKLPMFTGSGVFVHRNDNLTNLKQYSNLIVLDFDHFLDRNDAQQFKEKLIQYSTLQHIYSVFISPSGCGVKAVMIHDNTAPKEHLRMFHQIKRDCFPKTPQFDMKCGNISRACFVSDDPYLYINQDPALQPYHFVPDYSLVLPSSSTKTKSEYIKGSTQKPFVHTPDQSFLHKLHELIERNELELTRDADQSLMDYLTKKWRVQFPNAYVDGNRHKSILARARTFCEVGILVDNAINYLLATFGRHGISEQEIRDMVNYCYNTNEENWGKDRWFIYDMRLKGKQKRIQELQQQKK